MCERTHSTLSELGLLICKLVGVSGFLQIGLKLSKNEVLTKFELSESSEDYAKFSCCIRIERLLLLLLEEGSLSIEREELMESEGTRLSCTIFRH